jgi:phospholipid/cholesterol/gamma-HCH transport system substrate-binding protein
MSHQRILEIVVGLFVILGVFAIFVLTFRVSNLAGEGDVSSGFAVTANFENIGGLKVGAPVSLAGVKIGRVTRIHIDPQSFEAVVTIAIRDQYHNIPDDSSASIYTAGLLGEQYIGVTAGGSERPLQKGDHLKFTQSALVLEQIIGQVLFSLTEKDPAPAAGTPPPAAESKPLP